MIYNFDNLSFQILTIDRFFHKEGVFNVDARPYAALSFRVSGTGMFEIGNKRFTTKPGDVLFLPADTPYKVEYSVSESIVVHFDNCNYLETENICCQNSASIGMRFLDLLKAWKEERSVNLSKSIIYDIFEKIATGQRMLINNSVLDKCVRYMELNFFEPELNMETLSNIAFISASSLQRAFIKCFGIPPMQYLIRLRMNRALELLKENTMSIKEISFACGFEDEKYFSRAFKKKYGYPPSHVRKHISVL